MHRIQEEQSRQILLISWKILELLGLVIMIKKEKKRKKPSILSGLFFFAIMGMRTSEITVLIILCFSVSHI